MCLLPLVIAAHPSEADRFELGLSDGGVCAIDPLKSGKKWGISPPLENGVVPVLQLVMQEVQLIKLRGTTLGSTTGKAGSATDQLICEYLNYLLLLVYKPFFLDAMT
ncbi:hypothetical protein L1887_23995 [Cichorium endivia]|nr:hypothetical protein L1887_23995 [Cichorium endivia]